MINKESRLLSCILFFTLLILIVVGLVWVRESNPNSQENPEMVIKLQESKNSIDSDSKDIEIINNFERIGFILSDIDLSKYEGSECTEGEDTLQSGISPLVENEESEGFVTLHL